MMMHDGGFDERAVAAHAGVEPFIDAGYGARTKPGGSVDVSIDLAFGQHLRSLPAVSELDELSLGHQVAQKSLGLTSSFKREERCYERVGAIVIPDSLFHTLS